MMKISFKQEKVTESDLPKNLPKELDKLLSGETIKLSNNYFEQFYQQLKYSNFELSEEDFSELQAYVFGDIKEAYLDFFLFDQDKNIYKKMPLHVESNVKEKIDLITFKPSDDKEELIFRFNFFDFYRK